MRRAPFVISGTLVGLVSLLSFRSTPAAVSLVGTTQAPTTSTPSTTSTTPAGASPPTTGAGQHPHGATTTTTPASPPTTVAPTTTVPTTVSGGVRSATGPQVNYVYGVMSVSVTASGSKVTSVKIATLNDGGNPQSQYIDQQSIPYLIQQAMAAQSSKIQGVSGATYTSEGFYTSLLAALKQLGLS